MQDLYTPITPCRIVDTRKAGGAIGAETRTYYVAGTFGFAPAGGTSGGCWHLQAASTTARHGC